MNKKYKFTPIIVKEDEKPIRYSLEIVWKDGKSDLISSVGGELPRPDEHRMLYAQSIFSDDVRVINMDEVKYYVCHPYLEWMVVYNDETI